MNGCLKNKMFLDNIENIQIALCHKKNKGKLETSQYPLKFLKSIRKINTQTASQF